MNIELPDFYALEDALLRLDADFSAAEMQGIASGVLAVNNRYETRRWIEQVLQGDPRDFHFQETENMLMDLYEHTLAQLNANNMEFQLLMPPEQDPLPEQLAALQKWCQGFAFGLAISGLSSMNDLPAESLEWAQDVIRIGAATDVAVSDEDDDEAEQAFAELVSFVSVGILMMNEEMQPIQGKPYVGEQDD